MFVTADQLVAHAVGDYIIQSHWMATEKTKQSLAAAIHALTYTLPFLFLTTSLPALAAITATHFAIDRWRLARYVVWAKNFAAPIKRDVGVLAIGDETVAEVPMGFGSVNPPWDECSATGYPPDTPPWLAVWLLIIADNTLHILCNAAAIAALG